MTDETLPPAIDPKEFAALQASVQKLEAKNQELLAEKAKAKSAAEAAALEAAKAGGDVAALEQSWQAKLTSRETELSQQINQFQTMLQSVTSGAAASELAAKLAMDDCSPALLPHIAARLTTEIKDGQPLVRVLDKDGKPSALTLAELEAEIKATAYLKPLIKGSAASGGFAPGGQGGASLSFAAMTSEQRQQLKASNPAEYDRIVKEYMG